MIPLCPAVAAQREMRKYDLGKSFTLEVSSQRVAAVRFLSLMKSLATFGLVLPSMWANRKAPAMV